MPIKPVKSGDPFNVSAATFNTMIEAANAYQASSVGNAASQITHPTQATVILVKNVTGGDVDQFAVLGVGDPIITEDDNAPEFKKRVTFEADTPADGDQGCCVVCLDALPTNAIGRAVIAGVTVAKVNFSATAHWYAQMVAGEEDYFTSMAIGPVQVLWRAGSSGEQWCIVRLGPAATPAVYPARIVEVGTSTNLGKYKVRIEEFADLTAGNEDDAWPDQWIEPMNSLTNWDSGNIDYAAMAVDEVVLAAYDAAGTWHIWGHEHPQIYSLPA